MGEVLRQPDEYRDPVSRRWLLAAVFLHVISRIPYIFLGYGGDDDAWRVARAARHIFSTGEYSPSRFPGYPLFEMINALLVPIGNWYLSNSATLVVSVVTLVVFYRIIMLLDLKHWKLLLTLFVFFPLFWTNSANTMDYMWAMLFVLSAFYFLLRGKFATAAVLVGISTGFRLTSCLFTIPFTAYLVSSGNSRKVFAFAALSAVFGCAAFSLPLYKFGLGAFTFYRPHTYELTHIPYYMLYTIGVIPCIILAYGIVRSGGRLWRNLSGQDAVDICCVTAVITVVIVFCLAPQDRVYLMPLFPFLFILMARFFSRRLLAVFTVFAILYGFARIELKDDRSLDVVRVRPHVAGGIVIGSYEHRRAQLRLRSRLAPYVTEKFGPNGRGVLVTGYLVGLSQLIDNDDFGKVCIPDVNADIFSLKGTEILILSGTVDSSGYTYFKEQGYRMVFVEGAVRYARTAFGFEIDSSSEEMVSAGEIMGSR